MTKTQQVVLLAALFVLAAGVVAWRVLSAASGSGPAPSQAPAAYTLHLAPVDFGTPPSQEEINDLCDLAGEWVAEVARDTPDLARTPARIDELKSAFVERLEGTLDPDFQRDFARSVARGATNDGSAFTDDDRAAWTLARQPAALAPIGLEHIEIIPIARGGLSLADDLDTQLSAVIYKTSGPMRGALPDDPIAAGLDVVEVRVPLLYNGPNGPIRTIVGYRLAWNPARSQWIPDANIVYYWPNESTGTRAPFIPPL